MEPLNILDLLLFWNLLIFGTCEYLGSWEASQSCHYLGFVYRQYSRHWPVGRRAEEEEKQVEGGTWMPGLSACIPVPVLQVPAGEERGSGGLLNLLKEEEENEEDEEGKDEEEMEGKRKDEEEMQDGLVVEEGMMVNFPLVPFPLVSFPCSSCSEVFPAKKMLNNPIVEMHKDPTSCIIC